MVNENKKEKILQSAIKIFANVGFEKATVDEISEKAGVAKGTIYYYFDSKEEIFESIIVSGKEKFINIIENEINKTSDVLEKIKILIETEHLFVREYRDFFMIFMADLLKKDLEFDLLKDLLIEGIDKNIFRKNIEVKMVSNIIFWMIAINALKSPDNLSIELVLKGLLN